MRVLKEINKICKKFLQSGVDVAYKTYVVNWKTVCHHFKEGGLGVRDVEICTKASITKHAAGDSPPPNGVRGRNCIMKDMFGRTIAYKSIQLSGVTPEGFYCVIVDEVILDDVQLFMEGGTLGDISSGETVV
ncbi:hypothetical protein GIB67_038766 [Kingdonia uniflora]|uniref:Uncharacterized protein n=1 Tax=Kingdonia uniflora TaxID=39325 RepID=A0A7J7NT11_9MAGN|nr:hypothetical protein GIB67_038766 [Kingdonia uniflora]